MTMTWDGEDGYICFPNPRTKQRSLCDRDEFSVTQNTVLTEINPSHSTRLWEICMDAIGIQSPLRIFGTEKPSLFTVL